MEDDNDLQLKCPGKAYKEYMVDPEDCSIESFKCSEKSKKTGPTSRAGPGQPDNQPPMTITASTHNPPPTEDEITMEDSTVDTHMTSVENLVQDLHGDMDQIKDNLQNLLHILQNPGSSIASATDANRFTQPMEV